MTLKFISAFILKTTVLLYLLNNANQVLKIKLLWALIYFNPKIHSQLYSMKMINILVDFP